MRNFSWPIFIVNTLYIFFKDIGPPGYIECDFGADFILKLQIPILCYSLKNDLKYHIKIFIGTNSDLREFFLKLLAYVIHLYMPEKTNYCIFTIFVKKCLIKFELNFYCGRNL